MELSHGVKAIVGLGNPGPRYAGTRHNVGFEVTRRLADAWGIPLKKSFCHSIAAEGIWENQPVALALPQTMMNGSGKTVACLIDHWDLESSQLLVVCDDIALPLGMIRLRAKGSEGGHKGLASIICETQTDAIPRLRVGIGTAQPAAPLTDFVLGRWKPAEKKILEESLSQAVSACEVWVKRGIAQAMNQFNRRVQCLK